MEEYIKSLARFGTSYDFLHYGKGNSADVIVDLGDFEVYLKIWRHGRITVTDKNINDFGDLDKVKVFLDTGDIPPKFSPPFPFPIRKYTYDENKLASGGFSGLDYLDYPYGRNVGEILQKKPDILLSIGEIFENFGLNLVVDLTTGNVEIHKYMGKGSAFKFDLKLVSDTLKRMIFYITALKSNRDSVIILEEPEIHTSPVYIQIIGRDIKIFKRKQQPIFYIHA